MATEFSRMKPVMLLALAIAAGLIFSMPVQSAQAATSNLTIDTSGTLNPTDFPYGIAYDSSTNTVWVTLFKQGNLVKIDVDSRNVTEIYNDPDGAIVGGQGFYSVAIDDDSNVWINERDNGKVWRFEPDTETWTSIPIVENLDIPDNPDVDYPFGYERDPSLIRIDENPGDHGVHTYGFGIPAFGGVKFANGAIYVGLAYSTSFDDQAETNANVSNVAFSGLAKIDPDTLAVTRIPIPGAAEPTGMDIDASDPSILWITDQFGDRVYKYDMTTDTVIENVTLAANSNPRGITDDASSVYVALNKPSGGNSQILKISKADTSNQTIIDTGAPIDNAGLGTFTVFAVGNLLLWTDQSAHVGIINLSNLDAKSFETVPFSDSNHFGVKVGDDFWFAGKGSAVVGITDIEEPPVDEEDESTPGNGSPPSKWGLGLGYMFGCYYSGEYCELISTIADDVMAWIIQSNHIESNPEVLQVLNGTRLGGQPI